MSIDDPQHELGMHAVIEGAYLPYGWTAEGWTERLLELARQRVRTFPARR
jgi:hypothetical protein